MGCTHSNSVDKTFDPPSPTVFSTASSRTYVFDDQAPIPENFCVPEIQVIEISKNRSEYPIPNAPLQASY
eukprot:CAMPEP_0119013306 /NCGR_PEP_ID=MMETSP1176-20130426/8373_1 /TAXON_ID=265551 /ORGANISM="Synedropsis recta cf, Strain CCMP1620" /LENGTH=69 /DNA_ID=CAMNT_0006966393 /DNA_START=88 /DNA_END=297 /DNA_ORIENTATION=+